MDKNLKEIMEYLKTKKRNREWKEEILNIQNYISSKGADKNLKKEIDEDIIESIKEVDLLDLVYTDNNAEMNKKNMFSDISEFYRAGIEYSKDRGIKSIATIEADKILANSLSLIDKCKDIRNDLYISNDFNYRVFKQKYEDDETVNVYKIETTEENDFDDEIDIYDYLIKIHDVDLVMAHPDNGRKFLKNPDNKIVKENRKEVMAINNLLQSMPEGSELSIIVPTGFLTSKESKTLREKIIPVEGKSEYNVIINYIFKLPKFKEYSSISLAACHFEKMKNVPANYKLKIGEIDIKNSAIRERFYEEIDSSKISGGKRWGIEENLDRDSFWEKIEEMDTKKLDGNSMLIRGKAISKKFLDDSGKHIVINLSNISKGVLEYHEDTVSIAKENKPKSFIKYEVNKGDVVVACRGTVFKSAYIPDFDDDKETKIYLKGDQRDKLKKYKLLASVNVIIVTLDENSGILPKYLNVLFNLPVGQKLLESIQRGDVIKNINPSDLEMLKIPNYSIEKQQEIIDNYENSILEIRNAKEKWENDQKQINNEILG